MNYFLKICKSFLKPDQPSCDLNFFALLLHLARKHKLLFCALNVDGSIQPGNEVGAQPTLYHVPKGDSAVSGTKICSLLSSEKQIIKSRALKNVIGLVPAFNELFDTIEWCLCTQQAVFSYPLDRDVAVNCQPPTIFIS